MSKISSIFDDSDRYIPLPMKWIANKKPNKRAKIRIFSFPCAGAGASYFRNWYEPFLPEIDFLTVQLPGRENRFSEPLYKNMTQLVRDFTESLRPYINMPFAFFGHSLGALISYELTRYLRRTHNLLPLQLFIAAYRAPHLPNPRPILHNLPDDDFINELICYRGIPKEIIENREMLEIITPIIKADYKIHETYIYKSEKRLRCPIMVFGGIEDSFVSFNDLEGWRNETAGECQIQMLPGGHYFINDNCELIVNTIKENLMKSLLDGCQWPTGASCTLEISTCRQRQAKESCEEQHQIPIEWNETKKEYPMCMLHEIFDQQVERTPDATAVIFEDEKLSYLELNNRANNLAYRLQELGIGPEAPVGVYAVRSPNTMIALLAIFKAGGAYVPLDLSYPAEHIAYILKETQVPVIITEQKLAERLPVYEANLLYLDSEILCLPSKNVSGPVNKAEPDNLALIMYTSGSTGQPKGVMIEHRQILNRFNWLWENYPFDVWEVTCQRTTVNFLPSVWELLGGLLKGVLTIILSDRIVKDPPMLIKTLSQYKVTRVAVVPSLLKMILDTDLDLQQELPELRLWFTAGEPLSLDLYQRFRQLMPQAVLHNDYGATEVNGVICYDSRWQTGELLSVPIGRPIANTQVYILNSHLQPVSFGVPGNLYVGGPPLSRGYLNRPDLTDERFIPHPFSTEPGARLYDMGDIARYRSDGMIEVVGRRDRQVKILGKRVELDGIEKVILQYPGIQASAVIAQEQISGANRLIAYVVLEQNKKGVKDDLRSFIKKKMPDFMVPSDFIVLKQIPLTPNGKVDRKLLSELTRREHEWEASRSGHGTAFERIVNRGLREGDEEFLMEIRASLVLQCGKILNRSVSEINENLSFTDQGLNSIDALTWIKTINQEFNLHLSVTVLFDHFSIHKLSKYLESRLAQENPKLFSSMKLSSVSDIVKKKSIKEQRSDCEAGDIAVIGISGRFPGANNISQLWKNIKTGIDSITEVPENRWSIEEYYDPDPEKPNKTVSKRGGFLNEVDRFEPLFFNISPGEAELMDPQQRICLEECWNALEDAGYSVNSLDAKPIGVFLGVRSSDYLEKLKENKIELDERTLTGNDPSILAGRISHYLNLKGPSLSIDTACSSSLVATHLACKSIQSGECELALAGGVCVLASESIFIMSSKAGVLSPRGKCRVFDDQADGFVLAEGAGIVVLKSLGKALEDRDNIYGVIKGSGINHTGRSNAVTVPSKDSQVALEVDIYRNFGLNPDSISYVEAHATGTKLGDLIEVEALTEAFRRFTQKKQYCAIGSIKTNIGHANAAAGIIGLIKILLCLKYRLLVPSLNYTQKNEHINFKESPFYVNTELQEWKPQQHYPRRCAINSFGYNGTNAHMVIEEAPVRISKSSCVSNDCYFIPFSAKMKAALYRRIKDFAYWLQEEGEGHSLGDIAYTLHMRRTHFEVRAAFVVKNIDELREKIEAFLENKYAAIEVLPNLDEGSLKVDTLSEKMTSWLMSPSLKDNNLKDTGYEEKLCVLAKLYTSNYDVDCESLYHEQGLQCISIPTYPFAGERFWIPRIDKKEPLHESGHNRIKPLHTYMAPHSEIEIKIVEIWQEVLKVEKVGIHDSFMDLGGNSVLMLQAHRRFQTVFNRDISIVDMFFKYPTVSALAKHFILQFSGQPSYRASQRNTEIKKRFVEEQRGIRLRNRRKKVKH